MHRYLHFIMNKYPITVHRKMLLLKMSKNKVPGVLCKTHPHSRILLLKIFLFVAWHNFLRRFYICLMACCSYLPGRDSLQRLVLCLINSATLISGPNHLDIPQKTLSLKALMTTGSCQRRTKSYCQGITLQRISTFIVNLHTVVSLFYACT